MRHLVLAVTALAALLPAGASVASGGSGSGARVADARTVVPASLKASYSDAEDLFGVSVAIDGDTLVVGASYEDSCANGVDGDQSDDDCPDAGAAYVFTRSGSAWSQQAYLKASNSETWDRFGTSVAIAGDTIVVGAPGEASCATGVGGDQSDNDCPAVGAAYVFTRSGSTWSQQVYLKAGDRGTGGYMYADYFGDSVAIDGDTLVVGAPGESSCDDDSITDPDYDCFHAGAAYVFTRSRSSWSPRASLKASNSDANDFFGASLGISGGMIVIGAYREDSCAAGIDGDQASDGCEDAGAAYVFGRSGRTWRPRAYLKASNADPGDHFGISVAIAGETIVSGASRESSCGEGEITDPDDDRCLKAGAAYVFGRRGSAWSQRTTLKASNTGAGDRFGGAVAIAGGTIVVGAPYEASCDNGAISHPGDDGCAHAGAAYVFGRRGSAWSQQAALKAGNSQADDYFGLRATLDRQAIVVGAPYESSCDRGSIAHPGDNACPDAGAAYVFPGHRAAPLSWVDHGSR